MTIDWARLAEIVRRHERFLLVSHIRPDCDALGSELGMAAILEALGKSVRIVNGDPTPPNLAFIDPNRRLGVIGKTVQAAELASTQVLMILDTSAWAQLGPMSDFIRGFQGKKIVIDRRSGRSPRRETNSCHGDAALCCGRHRHRLVSLCFGVGGNISRSGQTDRCRRESGRYL
jgi:nanoRNase/pAp phosphatase (c-di-AMP/oligoRNAs hydrolase)